MTRVFHLQASLFCVLLRHSSAIKLTADPFVVHTNHMTSSSTMSEGDEFTFDDWDDASLAELNATEQRISYQLSQTQGRLQSAQLVPPTKQSLVRQSNFGDPPAKRLKPNNWNTNASSSRYIPLSAGGDTVELEVFAGSDGRARIFDPKVPPRTTSFAVPSKQITNTSRAPVAPHGPVTRRPHGPGRPPPTQRPSVGAIAATIRASQGREEATKTLESPVFDLSSHGHHRPPIPARQSIRTNVPPSQQNNQVDAELSRLRAELAQVCLDHAARMFGFFTLFSASNYARGHREGASVGPRQCIRQRW